MVTVVQFPRIIKQMPISDWEFLGQSLKLNLKKKELTFQN